MKNEVSAAISLVAQGKTKNGSMEKVLPNAVANVVLARTVHLGTIPSSKLTGAIHPSVQRYAEKRHAEALAQHLLLSGGVPSDKKPLSLAVAKSISKLPNGSKTAAQAWLDNLRANKTEGVKPPKSKMEAPTGGDEAYTEGAGERHEAAFAGSKTKSGLTRVKTFPKLQSELAAERIASMTPAEWSPMVSMATFSAPGAAITGTGESLFGSGSELISVAGKMQGEIAKGSYEDRKVVLDDLMKKSEGSSQSASAKSALKLFDKAKNALGEETRKSNTTFKAIGDAFDVVEKATKEYIDKLPPEQKKMLADAYSEAAAIGKQVKAEMAPIMSKIQDLAKGASKMLSEVIADQTGESKEHKAPAFKKAGEAEKEEEAEKPKWGKKSVTPKDKIKEGLAAAELGDALISSNVKVKGTNVSVKAYKKPSEDKAAKEVAKEAPKSGWGLKKQNEKVEAGMFDSLFDRIKEFSPELAAGIVSIGKEKDAIMKSARDKAEKISNDISESLPFLPSFEDSVKAFDSAVEESAKLQEEGMKVVTSLFDSAEKAFDTASKLVDAEARKNGKIWVDSYIKATGDKVEGFWRSMSDTVFGKKVGAKSEGNVRVNPF